MGRRKKSPPADDPMDDSMAYFTDEDWHRMSILSLESLRKENTELRPKIESLRRLLIAGGGKDDGNLAEEIREFIEGLQMHFDVITWEREAYNEHKHKLSMLKDKLDACFDALEHPPTAFRIGIANPKHEGHPSPTALLGQLRDMTARAMALPAVRTREGEEVDLSDKLRRDTDTTEALAMLPSIERFWHSKTGKRVLNFKKAQFPHAVMEVLRPYEDVKDKERRQANMETALKTYIGKRNKQLGIASHGRRGNVVSKTRSNSRR